ncbi:hypothetical protein KEM56_004311 [Ascosphaera pollenicola]|nr:hypothetical protein KEM56_004311 [Ascosphaera pollenicola]
MASHPIGSTIFLSLSLFFLSLLVLLLLRHYLPLRKTPVFLLLPVFFAIFLPASLVLLVPVDLGSTLTKDPGSFGIFSNAAAASHKTAVWLPERVVLVMWRIAYWLIFVLTWIILPFLSEYLDSYHPSPQARTIASLRANAKYHLLLLSLGIAGVLYVTISYGLRIASLKSLIMALAYIWGLALAIYLMGHGLVAVPRHIWRKRNYAAHLKRLQTRAVRIWDALVESRGEMAEVERIVGLVGERKGRVADPSLTAWVDELARDVTFNAAEVEAGRSTGTASCSGIGLSGMETAFPPASTEELRAKIPSIITERYLADLTRRLHRARHRHARFLSEWTRLIQDALDTQAVIESVAKGRLEFAPRIADQVVSSDVGVPSPSRFSNLTILTPPLRYTLYVHILPPLRVVVSALLAAASLSIVLSEIFKSIFPPLSFVSLSIFPQASFSNKTQYTFTFPQQLTTAFWLMYMSLCAVWTLTTTPLTWRQRALVPRNTHGESAAWYAGQVARLTVPMAYNFVTLLPEEVRRKTVFYGFLGRWVDFTSLGKGVDRGFPVFILVPVLLGVFDVYGKLGRKLGLTSTDDYDDDVENERPGEAGISTWLEGRQLIEQEINGPGALGLTLSSPDANAAIRGSSIGSTTLGFSSASASTPQSFISSAPNFLPFSASSNTRPRSSAGLDRNPNTGSSSSGAPLLSRVSDSIADTAGTSTDGAADSGEPEDENAFMAFAHRVKNTVETVNWPWQQDAANARSGRAAASGSNQGPENVWDRWFGGGGGGGGVGGAGGGIRL